MEFSELIKARKSIRGYQQKPVPRELIEEIIDREIRPQLKKDGGDIELLDIVGDRVIIAFRGMCAGCQSAAFTRQDFIEAKLREFVDPAITVEDEGK